MLEFLKGLPRVEAAGIPDAATAKELLDTTMLADEEALRVANKVQKDMADIANSAIEVGAAYGATVVLFELTVAALQCYIVYKAGKWFNEQIDNDIERTANDLETYKDAPSLDDALANLRQRRK